MGRIIGALAALVLIIALIAAGWYYRPWSPYSPARITALDDPEEFAQTFQRMDEILPSRRIEATNPRPFPEALAPLEATYSYGGETRTIDDFMSSARTLGMVVLRDGAVVAERYGQGADAETRFTSWSVAKSFVATLIAMAMEQGLIDSLDDNAAKYAPAFEGTAYGETSLRHLLMMSGGVDFVEEYSEDRESDIRPFFFNAFILGQDVDVMAGEIERDREPGRDLHYVSPNTHVLSAVVRNVFNDRLAGVVENEIWVPLGMTSDATWLTNVDNERAIEVGYCCLQATTRDFGRLGQFYLQDGVWEGQRLVPEDWVDRATRPNAPFQEPGPEARYAPRGYGLHFWIPPDAHREFFMAGVYGQYVWIDRDRNVVVAMNAGDPDWGEREEEAFALMRAIVQTVAPPEQSGNSPDVDPATSLDEDQSGQEPESAGEAEIAGAQSTELEDTPQ